MALCNAYQFFLLVGLLGSFRSDVVNGQGGLTNQTTNGDTLTASPNQTVTSIQNSTDANTDGRSRNTTTVLTTPEIIDTLTDLTTLSDTHTLKSESSAFTDLTTSETSEEGRELVTDFGATTIFKPVTQMWNNEGTGLSTESDDTAIPRETNTEEMMTTLPLEFTTVGDNLQVSTPDDDNDDLATNAMEHEYNRDWSTESDDTTDLPEDNTAVMLTTLPTEVVTDIDSEMQLSTLNGEFNSMDTTSLDEGYATDWSTQSDETTVLMETDTAKSIGTSHTEYVSDVDSTVSTLDDEYDDLTTKELADEYETAFTTEADSFSTTEIWTELFGDLITTDQSTSIAGENDINTDGTLHEYATTLSLDATTFNDGMSTDESTELVWSTVMDDTQTTIVTQEDQLTSEITDEDVATNFMDKISTETNRNPDNKNLSETVTIFEDLTTVFDIEGTGDVTTSWPSQDVVLTEMVTILNELHTGMDSTNSTKSDNTNNFVTENSQDRSDVESTTLMMENTRTEKASGDDDKEEDSVTEIIFTEEYVTETSSSDDKTSNEYLFSDDVTTYETAYDNKTKTTDKSTFTTNSALSVTTNFPFTTDTVVMLDNTISFLMKVDISINITGQAFIDELEQELSQVIQTSTNTGPLNTSRRKRSVKFLGRTLRRMFRRHRRALNDAVTVTVTNVTRQNDDPEIVKTTFTVDVNGTTLSATNAASLFDDVSESKLSAALGYEVLSKPVPENLLGTTVVSLGPLDVPSGDLRDFLMITLLVPLSIDISGAVFQTDVANGLESLYLAGMELSSVNNRKRRRVKVLLDGRIITVKETERLRRRRQAIEDPSEEYVVKLKSVNRPISTKMEVDIVFCVVFHDQVIRAESAIERLEMLPLSFMTTVLGYQVKEPGVAIFKNHGNRIVWLIIIADIAVIVILLIILAIYCCCVKVKRAEFHKQALLSKVDRSTSIEMGFVRIGVQSSDQMATTQKTKKHKSGAHVMHGTARDKVHRKRHRKQGAFISEYRLGGDSSSDEDSKKSPHLVKPSQIVSHNRIHPDVSALVPFSGTDDEYDKQEYIRRFKKRDDDEDMRRQQHLQEQLNKEMTARLGAASGEGSSLRSQIGEMFEGAANLNITDRMSANNRKKKKKKKLRKEEAEIVVEDSGNRKRKLKKKTVVHTPEVATKVTPQKKTIQRGNSFTKSAFDELTNNRDSEVDQEIVYQELCRKWRKERKRLNKFLDEAFTMTASLLDTSKRTPSPVRPLQRSPVGEEMSPLYEIHANRKLPTNRDSPTNGELSTNRELPPIRQTPLTVAPLQPNPYLYHHSVGVPYYFPADSSQIDKSDPYLDQMYEKQLKKEVKVPLNQQRKSKENKTQNKVDWLQTLTKYDEKLRHVPTLKEDSIKKRKSRKNKYS